MSQTEASASLPENGGPSLEVAHAQVLRDKTVQFAHIDQVAEKEPVPDWMQAISDWIAWLLEFLSPVIAVMFWIGLACLVLLLIYFILTEVLQIEVFKARAKATSNVVEPEWRPSSQVARDLLAAADALAAEGRFNDAVHLILLRSIEDIERFRPTTIRPALTARDIGAMQALPAAAKPIFARISAAVEKAIFAGLTIEPSEFVSCREAYMRFALPDEWRQ